MELKSRRARLPRSQRSVFTETELTDGKPSVARDGVAGSSTGAKAWRRGDFVSSAALLMMIVYVRDVCPKAVCVRAPRVGGRPRGPGGMAPTDHRQPWLGVRPNAHVENWGALRERLEFGFRFDKRRWSYLLAFGVAVPLLTYNAIKDDLVRGGGAPFRHATAPLAAERRRMGHAVRRGTKLATIPKKRAPRSGSG